MRHERRVVPIFLFTGILIFLLAGWGSAQEKFPSRPVQFVIPWAAGGGGTINAQALQPQFEKSIQGSIQIVNKPGGGGTIAWNYVANSAPDGYTTGITNQSFILTQYTTRTGVNFRKVDPVLMVVDIPAALGRKGGRPLEDLQRVPPLRQGEPGKGSDGELRDGGELPCLRAGHRNGHRGEIHPCALQGQQSEDHRPSRGPCGFRRVRNFHSPSFRGRQKIPAPGGRGYGEKPGCPGCPVHQRRRIRTGPDRGLVFLDRPEGGSRRTGSRPSTMPSRQPWRPRSIRSITGNWAGLRGTWGPRKCLRFSAKEDKTLKKIIDFSGFKPIE